MFVASFYGGEGIGAVRAQLMEFKVGKKMLPETGLGPFVS